MKTKKLTTEAFIERIVKVHGDHYDYSLIDYTGMFSKVKIICSKHGDFEKEAKSFLNGSGCPECFNEKRGDSQRLNKIDFAKRALGVHGNKYNYSLVDYKNNRTKVKIICPIHGEFEQSPQKHLDGQGCGKCGLISSGNKQSETARCEFVIKAKQIHGDKYDYSLVDYKNSNSKIKIICPEHGVWEQRPNGHLNGKGCRSCSGYEKLTNEDFIRRAKDVHDNKYDYSLIGYNNHYDKVRITCPVHGEFEQGAGSHLAGVGCPECCESRGEREISSWLLRKKINFQKQKTFNNCKYKRQLYFDFYLPDYNICFEYDGKQHFEPVVYFGGEDAFNENKKRDSFKNKFCKKHNIHLLRITYKDDVFNTLEKWYTQKEKIIKC